jgi:2-C-methyl-D-erythritol 4-phosphate cytidylyltransferase
LPTAAIVPAAGRGVRLGPGDPKALRTVAGQPLLVHAVRGLWHSGQVDLVVVAAPPGQASAVHDLLSAAVEDLAVTVVEGGASRQQSVALALAALPAEPDVVLVHDAARAFTPSDVTRRVVQAVRAGAAAVVPVVPVADTVKQVSDGGTVERTVDRSRLRAVQTPQGFRRDVLERAHAGATAEATDDAALAESLGEPVTVVAGSEEAFKVTRPLDLLTAEALLRHRDQGSA